MGKTEGIFLNLQCNCHIVGSIIIKLINHRTISVGAYMAARFDSANAAIKKMESPSLDTEPAVYFCSRPSK